jgi:hypothetical protein
MEITARSVCKQDQLQTERQVHTQARPSSQELAHRTQDKARFPDQALRRTFHMFEYHLP